MNIWQIPIWCSVINEVVFGRSFPLTPPPWMSPSVIAQINSRIPAMVLSVGRILRDMVRDVLKGILLVPFMPIWVCPDEDGVMEWMGEESDDFLDRCCSDEAPSFSPSPSPSLSASSTSSSSFAEGKSPLPSVPPSTSSSLLGEYTPLILFSCSPVRSENTHSAHHSWKYIQGAGDDEENWSNGLSSEMFWKNKQIILASDDPREVRHFV